VRFSIYSNDHLPPHAHGFYGDVEVLVEINAHYVDVVRRKDAILPRNAKSSDVAHILDIAALHKRELLAIWRRIDVASGR